MSVNKASTTATAGATQHDFREVSIAAGATQCEPGKFHVSLEEISWEHYEDLKRITSIGSVMQWIADQKVWSDSKLRRFIEYSLEEQKQAADVRVNYYSAIMTRSGDHAASARSTCVGVVGVHPVTYKSGKGNLSADNKLFMTIFVDEAFHRRGIASAAIHLALERFALSREGCDASRVVSRIYADIQYKNVASRKLFNRCGFRVERTVKFHNINHCRMYIAFNPVKRAETEIANTECDTDSPPPKERGHTGAPHAGTPHAGVPDLEDFDDAEFYISYLSFDRIEGMLHGHALGDALGAPHEFQNRVGLEQYTGNIIHPFFAQSRWQGRRTGVLGQVTDDTEMSIALLRSLRSSADRKAAVNPGTMMPRIIAPRTITYDREAAVKEYLAWANSGCQSMGTNTRNLLYNVKTVRGYESRREKHYDSMNRSQSNGCLMRAAPLTLVSEYDIATAEDCAITNPHEVCIDAVAVYVRTLRTLLETECDPMDIDIVDLMRDAAKYSANQEVEEVILSAIEGEPRNIVDFKGWVLNSLYCAFAALHPRVNKSYQDAVDWVVRLGGDTDTNAAIAGALLGAFWGIERMRDEERTGANLEILIAANPFNSGLSRPDIYHAARLNEHIKRLFM